MKKFSSADAVKYGWRETEKNFWFFACVIAMSALSFLVFNAPYPNSNSGGFNLSLISVQIACGIVYLILGMGIVHVSLKIYDRRRVSFNDLVDEMPIFFKYIGASLLYGLIVTVGFILFIVPGIIFGVKYGFYPFVLIDRKSSVIESLKQSAKITRGNKLKLFSLGILLAVINILGLVPIGLGLFITLPIGWMAAAYAYRRLG